MKARLTQLVARYVAAGLTAVAGWLGAEGAATGDLAAAVALVVVSAAGFAADLLIHRKNNGGVMKTPAKPAIILAACLLLAGCSSTPAERWAAARSSVTTAQDVTMALHETEVISDEDVLAIGPYIVTARGLVNAAYPLIDEGGPEFDAKLAETRDILKKVRTELKEHQ